MAASLSGLLQKSTIVDHNEVLKACNTALKSSKGDVKILHIKVVALLKLDRYEDALQVLSENGEGLRERAKFESAYALYKTGKQQEAKEVARDASSSRGAQHVEAQASYRFEDFANASKIYSTLLEGSSKAEDDENELRINRGAIDAQLELTHATATGPKTKPSREDLELFETAYNQACISIGRCEFAQARFLLKRAQDLCLSSEDLSDEEKAAELLPIQVQQLYVLTRLGNLGDAEALASQISNQEILDSSVRIIASNNIMAVSHQAKNPYLDHRSASIKVVLEHGDQLFAHQDEVVKENELALDLLSHKPKAVTNATAISLTNASPSLSAHLNHLSVLNAAAHVQGDLAGHALNKLLSLFEERPTDLGLALTIIQLQASTKDYGSAINVLEKLLTHISQFKSSSHEDVLYAPGLVALQVSLYSTQNRKSQITDALARAASYWCGKPNPPTSLLEAAGGRLVKSSHEEHQDLARRVFSTLLDLDSSSKPAAAGFVASHAQKSPDVIEPSILAVLSSVEELVKDIDVSALEAAGIASLPDGASSAQKRALFEKPEPRKKKRVRKSRLPKDFDPNKKPDSERWLPLKDRSYYRAPKKKGKKREAEKDKTQGGIVDEKPAEKAGDSVGAAEKMGGAGVSGKPKKGKKKGKR